MKKNETQNRPASSVSLDWDLDYARPPWWNHASASLGWQQRWLIAMAQGDHNDWRPGMAMTACPHCGFALPSNADAFCANCRESLDQPVAQHTIAEEEATDPVPTHRPETVEDFHAYALECLLKGTKPPDVRNSMTEMGCPPSQADEILHAVLVFKRDNESRAKSTPWALDKEYMCMRFPEMRWVESVPSMNMVNGFGFTALGERDRDAQTNTFVTTVYLCLLFIPVFAFGSYRVAEISGDAIHVLVGHMSYSSWRFYGSVPMSRFAKSCNFLVFMVVASFVVYTLWKTGF